jgi:hypothetical protein
MPRHAESWVAHMGIESVKEMVASGAADEPRPPLLLVSILGIWAPVTGQAPVISHLE